MNAFLITFRESLEAGVIVGMLFAILTSLQARKHDVYIWLGVAAGIVGSFVFYFLFQTFGNGFSGASEKIYEGILMLVACALITHMIFWMKRQSKNIKANLKKKVQSAIATKTLWMLSIIAFCSVVREGIETVIFFSALEVQSGGWSQIIFALIGVIAAIGLSIGIYRGSKKIRVSTFFQVSGILLLLVSAGLLAHGIVELQGANILPTIMKPVYDITPLLSEKEGIGSFFKAMFGYDGNPSLIAVISYLIYGSIALSLYLRKA